MEQRQCEGGHGPRSPIRFGSAQVPKKKKSEKQNRKHIETDQVRGFSATQERRSRKGERERLKEERVKKPYGGSTGEETPRGRRKKTRKNGTLGIIRMERRIGHTA